MHRGIGCVEKYTGVRTSYHASWWITEYKRGEELSKRAGALSECVGQPLGISFGNVGRTYVDCFRVVFLEVIGSQDIRRLHKLTQEKMQSDRGDYYSLHLSLVYGGFDPDTIDRLKLQVERMTEPMLVGANIFARAIELWHTQGEVHEWRRVAEFPFASG